MGVEYASGLLERHAPMLELKSANTDANRLAALIQDTKSTDSDGGNSLGAPPGPVHEGHSGGIVDTLRVLLDKSEAQLGDARNADLHNYQVMKQSLVDEVK